MSNPSGLKIAVQLYGHLRTFETCAPALHEHLLKHYDCDVFIHTWQAINYKQQDEYNELALALSNQSVRDRVQQLYQPKALKIETQDFISKEFHIGINITNIKYMLYSMHQANKLREDYQHAQKIDYDYVVVTRPDVLLHSLLDFSRFYPEFAFFPRTSIHFIHRDKCNLMEDKVTDRYPMSDCYYFSTANIISEITNLYNELEHYLIEISTTITKELLCPEVVFFESIFQKNIIPRQYQLNYTLKRKRSKRDTVLTLDSEAPKPKCKDRLRQYFKRKCRNLFKKT